MTVACRQSNQKSLFASLPETRHRAGDVAGVLPGDSDGYVELGAAYISEFSKNWPNHCENFRDDSPSVHWLIYALCASRTDDNNLARVTTDQFMAWSGLSAHAIEIVLENLCDEEDGLLEEVGTPAVPTYRVYHLHDEGELIIVPNSLLRDPTITPAAKRAAMGALLNGQQFRGGASDGSLSFSIPNDRDASPDALIEEGRRQATDG
jgi:hypothetical protein